MKAALFCPDRSSPARIGAIHRLDPPPPSPGLTFAASPRISLIVYAAKSRIYILIMRLEPIPERRPQHAFRRPRGPAFHHVMLAIEKIRRISRIKIECLESREWREHRGRPLPAVPQHVRDPERAVARGKVSHRRGVPAMKIEVAVPFRRGLRSPRIDSLSSQRAAVSRPLPLRFARQFLARPSRKCRRFRMTYIHRHSSGNGTSSNMVR